MTITTIDQGMAAASYPISFNIASISTVVAGNQVSLWRAAGSLPAQQAIPGAASVPVGSSAGMGFPDPLGGAKNYPWVISATATAACTLVLYDRLSHMGGLSGTVTTAQTVSTAAITRGDTTGLGVEAFLEWYTATGGTGDNATVAWTDHANAPQSSVIALAATRPAGFMAPISLQDGSRGVRSVQTVTLSATTGTAGNFGVTLCRRVATIPIAAANTPVQLSPVLLGLREVPTGACMFFAAIISATASPVVAGEIVLKQG